MYVFYVCVVCLTLLVKSGPSPPPHKHLACVRCSRVCMCMCLFAGAAIVSKYFACEVVGPEWLDPASEAKRMFDSKPKEWVAVRWFTDRCALYVRLL